MQISFKNGQIITDGYLHEDVPYDVSANQLSVCFDGKGGLSKYLSVRTGIEYSARSMTSFYKDGRRIGAYTNKRTSMAGRKQEICLSDDGFRIEMKQFITKDGNAVFVDMRFYSDTKTEFTLLYGTGASWVVPAFACDGDWQWMDENYFFKVHVPVDGEKRLRFVVQYEGEPFVCEALLKSFDKYLHEAEAEIDGVIFPSSVKTEEEKALYMSALFCCIENYKQYGGWEGFVAGCNYLDPLRTYYRDSYWTILPMYAYDVTLIKRQILTLAKGIFEDGSCPSAVKTDFSGYWGGHYDSPCFFVMMAYDYVNHTGDQAFLQEKIGEKTIVELCELVLKKQFERTDETGLIYKEGPFNKLDWADEVNRNGYVTYDEALFYRAVSCMEKLCRAVGKDGEAYRVKAEQIKTAINEILWDEEKGYYVNYKDGAFTEDNLSVDTVLVYLFGIADETRANRMLDAMERLLETKNNSLQKAGDYGIMCVYPFYKGIDSAYFKSSQDYEYHNGANWPYWSAIYAYAKYLAGRDYRYALESWFFYNLDRGIFTPIEYFSPCRKSGSTLQAWSGMSAFVYDRIGKESFFQAKTLK